MKKEVSICDNCGQEIKGGTRRIEIRGDLTIHGPGIEKDVKVSEDLCLSCAKESFEMNVLAIPVKPRSSVAYEME